MPIQGNCCGLGERRSTHSVEPEPCSGRSERPAKDGRAGAKRSLTRRAMDGGHFHRWK